MTRFIVIFTLTGTELAICPRYALLKKHAHRSVHFSFASGSNMAQLSSDTYLKL